MILRSQKYFTLEMVHKPNTKNGSQLRYACGLTLIEIMVVATIISIVMLIAIPSFSGMQKKEQLSAAAKTMAQNFKQTRERALASNNPHWFKFTTTTKIYTARYKIPLEMLPYSKTYKLGGTSGGRVRYGCTSGTTGHPPEGTLSAPGNLGLNFPNTGDSLIFNGHGGAGPGVVYITDDNENYAIGINELGKVRVYRGVGSNWY